MKHKTLGIILFPGFELLDVFGPLEMFSIISDKIKVILIAETSGVVESSQGTKVVVDADVAHSPPLDILLVPGGIGTRKEVFNDALLKWIKNNALTAELVLSVCTGAALLAKAGILDNRNATSNKLAFDWVMAQGLKVKWIRKARWVEDGKIITSSGVSAGIDMSLHVIERLYGPAIREDVAIRTEYSFCSDSLDDKFS